MKRVSVKLEGQAADFGRFAMSERIAMRANDRTAYGADVQTAFSNINDLPQAPANTGMMAHTRVASPDGPRRIDELKAGALVLNAQGQTTTVRHVLTTDAPRNSFMIRAPYFGLDQDLVLAPEQKIVISSVIAEYLFGEETIMVPVWALNDGTKVGHYETRKSDRMYQLQLDSPATLAIGRCEVSALHKTGATDGYVLSDAEARCFATEYRTGFHN